VVLIGYIPCNLLCNHFLLESLYCQSRDNSINLKTEAAHYFRTSVLACNTVQCLSLEDLSGFVLFLVYFSSKKRKNIRLFRLLYPLCVNACLLTCVKF
jgi:hypothetical protein